MNAFTLVRRANVLTNTHQGETQNRLIDIGNQRSEILETYIVKPGYVLASSNSLPNMLVSLSRSIKVNELAAVMLATALEGSKKQVMENGEMITQARALLNVSTR